MKTPKETILKVLNDSLGNAQDAIARAEMQLKRMPFDHDTRDALERYKVWETETLAAIKWVNEVVGEIREYELLKKYWNFDTSH